MTVPARLSVRELVDDYFLRLGHHRFPVSSDGEEPVGVVTLEKVKDVPKDERDRTKVEEIMSNLGDEDVIRPDASLHEVLGKFRHGDGDFLVMGANHRVQGILTRNELLRLLEVRQVLSQ